MTPEDFLPDVMIDVPGCPEPVAVNALRHALEEFCRKSLWWTADISPIDVIAGVHTYDLVSPVIDTVVAGILRISHDGHKLDPMSEDWLDNEWPRVITLYPSLTTTRATPWDQVTSDIAQVFLQPTPRTVRLIGIPTTDLTGGITAKVGIAPTATSTEVDDTLADYREAIANGAKYRLLMQPNKEWTDRDGAPAYKTLFDASVSEAKSLRLRSHARDDQTVIRTTPYWR